MLPMLSGGAPISGQAPPFSLTRGAQRLVPREDHVSDVSGSRFFSFFLSRARFCCGNSRLKEKEENGEPLTTTDH
jgi:hypothetical protein